MSIDLAIEFVARHTLVDSETPPFYPGDPAEATELLWPMLAIFQNEQGRALADAAYDAKGEAEVDRMMEGLAANPFAENNVGSVAGARVLLERVKQSIVTMSANAAENRTVLLPSRALQPGLRQVAIALLWLHRMELPFEPGTVVPRGEVRH